MMIGRLLFVSLLLCQFLPAVLCAKERSFYNGKEKRVALVIGVGAYQFVSALDNPKNDAVSVTSSLVKLGFDVTTVLDPTYLDIKEKALGFLEKLQEADVAVLYYAGHSIQIDGGNYLIPVDAQLSQIGEVRRQTYELARIVNLMDKLAKTKIIILDACRDNPFVAQLQAQGEAVARRLTRGLASFDSLVGGDDLKSTEFSTYGTVVSYAAAPGHVAEDGVGRNSPFTTALLQYIEKPGMEIGRLFRSVANAVIKETEGRQKPEYLVKLSNEFYFRNPEPHHCDYLAVEPYNNLSIKGVDFDSIDTAKAIAACRVALKLDPQNPRYLHNLARSLDAAGQHKASIPYYQKSAKLGYIHAQNNLGVMYVNGLGVSQDFVRGNQLLKAARARGHVQARVNLQGTDFSVLMKPAEITKVQHRLQRVGVFHGAVNGVFNEATKRALKAFQQQHKLAENGLTLETLDKLDLVALIPAFRLQ